MKRMILMAAGLAMMLSVAAQPSGKRPQMSERPQMKERPSVEQEAQMKTDQMAASLLRQVADVPVVRVDSLVEVPEVWDLAGSPAVALECVPATPRPECRLLVARWITRSWS